MGEPTTGGEVQSAAYEGLDGSGLARPLLISGNLREQFHPQALNLELLRVAPTRRDDGARGARIEQRAGVFDHRWARAVVEAFEDLEHGFHAAALELAQQVNEHSGVIAHTGAVPRRDRP